MKIIGFSVTKISIERKNEPKGQLELKSGLNIDDIVQEKINISEKSSLKFSFTFTIDYQPNVAQLEIKGILITLDDKDESKDILKEWKKKKFEHPVKLSLFNFIMEKCNLKALQLEEEVGLPFHIPFPKLAPAQNKDSKNDNPANYAG